MLGRTSYGGGCEFDCDCQGGIERYRRGGDGAYVLKSVRVTGSYAEGQVRKTVKRVERMDD